MKPSTTSQRFCPANPTVFVIVRTEGVQRFQGRRSRPFSSGLRVITPESEADMTKILSWLVLTWNLSVGTSALRFRGSRNPLFSGLMHFLLDKDSTKVLIVYVHVAVYVHTTHD